MKTGEETRIMVVPEAMYIIDRYKGIDWLLSPLDTVIHHESFLKKWNKRLKTISGLKEITTYYAHHSWATIAGELGVQEIVADSVQARKRNTVGAIYMRVTQKMRDKAITMVRDSVMYNK